MNYSWKYWGPFVIFCIFSMILWAILRILDFFYDVLIIACFIILFIGVLLFIIAIIPPIFWVIKRLQQFKKS